MLDINLILNFTTLRFQDLVGKFASPIAVAPRLKVIWLHWSEASTYTKGIIYAFFFAN